MLSKLGAGRSTGVTVAIDTSWLSPSMAARDMSPPAFVNDPLSSPLAAPASSIRFIAVLQQEQTRMMTRHEAGGGHRT